ncbi:MAG TPA: glycerol-3-phosphate 1-O-acyltransferase PlsY [Balneolaceae bacterium]|nr:glycerol-3-phosphate 1-O-acyltransferase PlsY [Balneolaceae bacterium]
MLAIFVILLISYVLGSIPTSIWVGKITRGVDIRNYGSGNAGATNTFRVLGWKPGVSVLLIDVAKGYVAAYWVSQLAFYIGSGPVTVPYWNIHSFLSIICGLVAVVGHMFPFLANFEGGKGMATASGMLIAIEPVSVGITFGVFLIIMIATHYVSLASLVAAFIYPLMLLLLRYAFHWSIDGSVIIFGAIVGAGIIIKHIGNIKRLLAGTESKISSFKLAGGWLGKEQKKSAA